MQHFFLYNSLLFEILSGDFQHKNRLADATLIPDHFQEIELFFLISKQMLRNILSRIFRTSIGLLKISFVSYIMDIVTLLV